MRIFLLTLLLSLILGAPRAAQAAPVFYDPGKYDKFFFFDFKNDFSRDWYDDHKHGDKDKYKWKWDDDWSYDDGKGCGKDKDCWKFDPGRYDHGHCDPGDPGMTPTPLPGSMLLFMTALLGLTGMAFRGRSRKA